MAAGKYGGRFLQCNWSTFWASASKAVCQTLVWKIFLVGYKIPTTFKFKMLLQVLRFSHKWVANSITHTFPMSLLNEN